MTDLKARKYENCFEGYCIDLLNKIREELQFNFTIRAVDSYGYMKETEPHEWDGMVRELQDRVSSDRTSCLLLYFLAYFGHC